MIASTIPSITDIGRLDFRTSRSGDTATGQLLRLLNLQYRYQPARLALGRSLGIATQPAPVDNFDGKAIRGETLFGQGADDIGLWTSLLVEHAGGNVLDRRRLQELIAAHWARGANLLWDDLREADDPAASLGALLLKIRK